MSLWTLCFLLDWRDHIPPTCVIEPSAAACFADMNDWLNRARAWEVRSGIDHRTQSHIVVQCKAEVRV